MESASYIGVSIIIPITYVAFIYIIFDGKNSRNHPKNVRSRLVAALANNVFVIFITFCLLKVEYDSPFEKMGFRTTGLFAAVIFPTLLTAVFYAGTWAYLYLDGQMKYYIDLQLWRYSINDICWLRDIIAAPISEELAFRACSATLFHHCFDSVATIFVSPLFFSICHFHHIFDDIREGFSLLQALTRRSFQALYTYMFGVYATYLFLSTGHILAPILSHSLCNSLGIPDLRAIAFFRTRYLRLLVWGAHLCGVVMWILFLPFFTNQMLYM